ncbi:MAG: CAP domain-containing protein [Lachnospiraceae bacterium]|nr:CAP domain-containing protein [Lachnospiraceae bacterium]
MSRQNQNDADTDRLSNKKISQEDLDTVYGGVSDGQDSELRALAMDAGNIINEERNQAGLSELDWDLNLEDVGQARQEAAEETWNHERPGGAAWNQVNSDIQGGENLQFGFDNEQQVIDDWMDSPAHRENITYDDFVKGDIAVYEDNGGLHYWSQESGYGGNTDN